MKSIVLLLGGLLSLFPVFSRAADSPKYLDASVPVEERIDDLLPRLTVDEKIVEISDDWGSRDIPRLKIPALLKTEGLHGQSYSKGATIFPEPICMAATFDSGLVGQIGDETALEAKADHIHSSWSPVLDVARDVRWGRVEETYGESPYLVTRMGTAWITAFQAEGMIAVPKHFAGHGEPEGGRDSNDIGLSDRVMREIFLPPYRAAIETAHAGGIMAAYSTWNGVPDNASTELLGRILRQEWGFNGYVVSDCGAIEHLVQKHGIAGTYEEAAALAAAAGVNMECGSAYKQGMEKALEDGLVTPEELDNLVRPILRAKFQLGLFEHPESTQVNFNTLPAYDSPSARALAREVAAEGAVLLKNDNNILPLSRSAKTIAVIGPNASLAQIGDYSPQPAPGQLITVLDGIKSHAGPGTRVVFAPGLDSPLDTGTAGFAAAIAAARGADVAVVVAGDNSRDGMKSTTGENIDGATLDFPGAQRALIKAIQATGTPVVLVIVNGKPFTLAWEAENIPAILVTWYPGEDGGDATADLLFGDRNPSGRLPLTWPRSVGQLPLHYDYHPSGRGYNYYDMPFTPQYRFGYGLSYTRFEYSNLQITPKPGDPGFVTVTADVRNSGDRDGDDVAQLYFTDVIASVSTPVVELGGFERVSLKKGETKRVSFSLTPYQLSLLDENMIRRVEPGTFRIHVGGVCPDVPAGVGDDRKNQIGFEDPAEGVSGAFIEPKAYAARFVYKLDAPGRAEGGQAFPATVSVRNEGNLTDVSVVKLYAGAQLDSWGFEINPGETKTHVFHPVMYSPGDLAVVAETQMVGKTVDIAAAPARLEIQNIHVTVDENDVLRVSAQAQNVGGAPCERTVAFTVDGQPVGQSEPLSLDPGEKASLTLSHAFATGGLHRYQIDGQPEQQIVVGSGIGFGLRNPLVDLKLDEGQGSSVRNEITGAMLPLRGSPAWVEGREGKALQLSAGGMDIDAGNVDIYRKAFTLSAWVKIDHLGNGDDLALFGGRAPMGADQDITGTELHAGVQGGRAFMGFFGRDISGSEAVPVGSWVNLAYTYDPDARKGSLYINGSLDKSEAQKPYTGPLQTIGDCSILEHGDYALGDVVAVQSCLTPGMIQLLCSKGLDALREGDYVSEWRPFAGTPATLTATADVPLGSRAAVTVEAASGDGKVTGSVKIPLRPGEHTYPLPDIAPGGWIHLRIQLAGGDWKNLPVVRAAQVEGGGATQRWSTPHDWSQGNASASLVTDYTLP
ncbi:MAG: glycoside hydrolase family 3 N-terminal domain-containing protein [Chthoniobacteraceae bacterium]|jgi:beta-glucosidase